MNLGAMVAKTRKGKVIRYDDSCEGILDSLKTGQNNTNCLKGENKKLSPHSENPRQVT